MCVNRNTVKPKEPKFIKQPLHGSHLSDINYRTG